MLDPVTVASTMIVPLVGLVANGCWPWDRTGSPVRACGSRAGCRDGSPRPWSSGRPSTLGLELLGSFGAIGTYPDPGLVGPGRRDRGGRSRWARGRATPDGTAVDEAPAGWEATSAWRWCWPLRWIFAIPSLFSAVKVVSDGPIYHLYFAARWWKAGRLILVAAPFGENAATYFPANGDLWFTWLMATWGGDTLAKVGQAPFLLLAGAAAYGCARLLGVGRSAAIDRRLLVRLVHAPVALLVRAERRHDLRGRLPAGGLFLPPVRAGGRRHAGPGPGRAGGRRGPGHQADRRRLRAAAARPGDRRAPAPSARRGGTGWRRVGDRR